MRSFISPLIILLLLFYVPAKAQSFTKISTAVLLQKAATDGTTFLNSSRKSNYIMHCCLLIALQR